VGEYADGQIMRWPKAYKYTRGTRIIDMMDEIAVLLEMAQRKYRVITSLHEADARLAALFRLLRRSNRTKYVVTRRDDGKVARGEDGKPVSDVKRLVDDHTYGVWSEMLVEIGKMLGGWIKAVDAAKPKSNGNE
jgi:hypothetical protein